MIIIMAKTDVGATCGRPWTHEVRPYKKTGGNDND